MPDGEDGTARAPFAFIRLQDACLPGPKFAMVNGATAPDITLVTGIADTHDWRSHLKFAKVDKLAIFLHADCNLLTAALSHAAQSAASWRRGSASGRKSAPTIQ